MFRTSLSCARPLCACRPVGSLRVTRHAALAAVFLAAAAAGAGAQTTRSVPAGGDLQAALDAAQPGDTILLQPGATYVGNFVLPEKPGSAFITIRSAAPDTLLPPDGTRITPAHAAYLPKLRSPNTMAVLSTAPRAHHYRLQFLEFQANALGMGDIIRLGDGSSAQSSLDQVPHTLIVDRVYIHGDPVQGQKRGIALNSASTQILNSYISEIKAAGQDSQAICGWNGPGPYLIANNYLEAAGENVMFGGADPYIPDLVPSDIVVVRNHLFKPLSWRGSAWTVKNLFELKNAQRVLVDGNLMENTWLAAQTGYAILLKSVNQDGRAPWSVVQDVTITNNVVRHVSSAINILGRQPQYPAVVANNIVIRNNFFDDVSGAKYGGSGRFVVINGAPDVTIDHNTVINDGSTTVIGDGDPSPRFVFTNNVIRDNAWGIHGSGAGEGNGAISMYFSDGQFAGNVIVGAQSWLYPSGNYYPADAGTVGFVDLAAGNYRLAAGSLYHNGGTDGRSPGADFDAIAAAQGGAIPTSPLPEPPPAPQAPGPVPSPTPQTPPPAPSQPDVPRELRAHLAGSTVTLAWSAPLGLTPVAYVLEAGTAPGASNAAVFHTSDAATSLVVTNVPAGVYYVRVRAVTAAGVTPASQEIRVSVGLPARDCLGPTPAPTMLPAHVSGRAVTLSWQAPAGCAPAYYVVVVGSRPGAGDLAQAAIGATGVSTVGPPGTYYVRVVAINAFGASSPSNEVVVRVMP